jgi:aspartyl-tRNA(Asn)/glutamyl-tRNA(Gln) amidotransferase subunit C
MDPHQAAPISADELRATAELAHLELSASERERLRDELARILAYVAQLAELDVQGVQPMTHPIELACPLRPDEVGPQLEPAAALDNAPAAEPPFFSVPAVFATRGDTKEGR